MKVIDKNLPILVTGATGYVAGWIVKKLLQKGHTEIKHRHLKLIIFL